MIFSRKNKRDFRRTTVGPKSSSKPEIASSKGMPSRTYQWSIDGRGSVDSLWLGNFQTDDKTFVIIVSKELIDHFPGLSRSYYSKKLGQKYVYVPSQDSPSLSFGLRNPNYDGRILEIKVVKWKSSKVKFPSRLFLTGRNVGHSDAQYVELVPSIQSSRK